VRDDLKARVKERDRKGIVAETEEREMYIVTNERGKDVRVRRDENVHDMLMRNSVDEISGRGQRMGEITLQVLLVAS